MKNFILISLLCSVCLFSCENKKQPIEKPAFNDSSLVALTLYGSTSYFIYKGEPMGYDYELLKEFAQSKNLNLEIKTAPSINLLLEMFEAGEGDLIAYDVPETNLQKETLIYCGKTLINEQVLVQKNDRKNPALKDVTELIGKKVTIISNSKYHKRLKNLNEELGGGIIIDTLDKDSISVEDLIEQVSKGEISYTFSDKNLAQLNKTYFPNLNINLMVSHPQRSSWVIRKDNPALADSINRWFEDKNTNIRYRAIIKKHFEMSKMPGEEPITFISESSISPYDHLFRKYASEINWDWKLLASLSCQESRFDTSGISWAGAAGLMGLMPQTAQKLGLDSAGRHNPEASIKAAVSYIALLNRIHSKVEDRSERIKLVLASYNAGIGHVFDAQALATKYGKDPHVWKNNVEECIKMKRLPEYYNDSVCKFGYFRGTETLNYVEHIIDRWHYYQEQVK